MDAVDGRARVTIMILDEFLAVYGVEPGPSESGPGPGPGQRPPLRLQPPGQLGDRRDLESDHCYGGAAALLLMRMMLTGRNMIRNLIEEKRTRSLVSNIVCNVVSLSLYCL